MIKLRESVEVMATRVELKMQSNDHKPHPWTLTHNWLSAELEKSRVLLHYAASDNDHEAVINHATNVAAYSAMLISNANKLMGERS